MGSVSRSIIPALWLAWCAYWFIAARDVKPIARRETTAQRFLHSAPLVATAILFTMEPRHLPPILAARWLPFSWAGYWLGVILVAAGLAFAVWARVHLGRNWSGVVSLKEGHDLVRSGPYRLVRHPIYAGLTLALLGSAIAWGDWRGLLALVCALFAIVPRVGAEDKLMAETFGEDYARYRRDTPAIIPFIL